jgi:TolA-binding protein
MYLRVLAVAIMICVAVSGCAALKNSDSRSHEMIKLNMAKDKLEDDVASLKQEQETSRRAMIEKQNEINQLNKRIDQLNQELDAAKMASQQADEARRKEAGKTGITERTLTAKGSPVEEKQVVGEKKTDAARSKQEIKSSAEKGVDIKTLKVKVLSGTGNASSAKQMASRLAKMGYKVKDGGMASRSNFTVNTVYFAPRYQKEAKRMAMQLGSNTIYKPMAWSSEFHMIVVTGR